MGAPASAKATQCYTLFDRRLVTGPWFGCSATPDKETLEKLQELRYLETISKLVLPIFVLHILVLAAARAPRTLNSARSRGNLKVGLGPPITYFLDYLHLVGRVRQPLTRRTMPIQVV